jgi:glycosyltransferase involved in cell wall biosynthesis
MQVLMTAPYFYPAVRFGGPVAAMTGLVEGLRLAGCQLRVLTTTADVDGHVSLEASKWLQVAGVPTWYEPAAGYPRRAPTSYSYSPRFRERLATFAADADAIISNGLFTYPALVTAQESRRLRKPCVIIPHGSLGEWSLRHKWWKKRLYWALIERRNVNGCSAVVYTATQEHEQSARLHLRAPAAIVPNCVSLDSASQNDVDAWRRRLNLPPAGRLIVFCGRLHAVKGLDLLLAAIQMLSARLEGIHLAIAGGGEEEIVERYRNLCERRGIAPIVTFIGHVSGTEKAALFAAADVFCLPSHHENFGMVVAEAMLASAPVVVSNAAAISRDVLQSRCGIVTGLDPEEISDALFTVLTLSPEARRSMGGRGCRFAEREYSCLAVGNRMKRILEPLTESFRLAATQNLYTP